MELNMRILLTIIITTLAVQGNSQGIEAKLDCQVTSNLVLTSSDGSPKSYNGFKDQFEIGDFLTFTYGLNSGDWPSVYCKLFDESRNNKHLGIGIPTDSTAKTAVVDNGFSTFYLQSKIIVRNDFILCEAAGETAIFNRYNNRFEGMFVSVPTYRNFSTHVTNLDCRSSIYAGDLIADKLIHNWD